MLEKEIQKAICDYLAFKKYFFWRNNNTPIYDTVGKKFRAMPKYTMNGIPDIIVIKDGQFIGLEVKRPKTYQSEAQKDFENQCLKARGQYHVVRSIDDVQKIML